MSFGLQYLGVLCLMLAFSHASPDGAQAQSRYLDDLSPETRALVDRATDRAIARVLDGETTPSVNEVGSQSAGLEGGAPEIDSSFSLGRWAMYGMLAVLLITLLVLRAIKRSRAKAKSRPFDPDIVRVSQGLPADGTLAEGQIVDWSEDKLEAWLDHEIKRLTPKMDQDLLDQAADDTLAPLSENLGRCEQLAMQKSRILIDVDSPGQQGPILST